jgi:hypothetical protein
MKMKKKRNMEDTYMIHPKFHDSAQFHTRSRMKLERRRQGPFSPDPRAGVACVLPWSQLAEADAVELAVAD